jgi:ABC-2 type transport system permease protein
MGRTRAVIWLHAIRTRRYLLSMISSSLTDTLWIVTLLLGFVLSGKTQLLAENLLGLIAWTIISNSAWMISGWVDYLGVLGLIEEHEARGTSFFLVLTGRIIPLLLSSGITSTITLIIFRVAGAEIAIHYPIHVLLTLILLVVQSAVYGLLLGALALKTGIPGYMFDIASLAFLGLALMPINEELLSQIIFTPLLGPLLATKLAEKQPLDLHLLFLLFLSTLLQIPILLVVIKKVSRDMQITGIKIIGEL